MNQTTRNIIYIILGVLMIIAFIYLGKKDYSTSGNHEKDNLVMARNYKSLEKDNIYRILNSDELMKLLDNGSGIILFCFKEAPWCEEYAKILNRTANLFGIKTIYYYDILKDREDKSYYYEQIINKGKDYLNQNDLGKSVLSVPDIFILKNGVLIGHNNDTSSIIGTIEPKDYWTIEKIVDLEIKLQDLIDKYLFE